MACYRNSGSVLSFYDYINTMIEKHDELIKELNIYSEYLQECEQFVSTDYEKCLLFNQIGITNYFNSNHERNHAWSVIKVKNSKGKTLWMPFDYKINDIRNSKIPYFKGIKGAPEKITYTLKDII